MSISQRRVERVYDDATGTLITSGTITFQLTSAISDDATVSVSPVPIRCSINSSGQLQGPDGNVGVDLYCVDDPTTVPQGAAYTVAGEPGRAQWLLIVSTADPNPVNLATKTPAASGSVAYPMTVTEAEIVATGVTAAQLDGQPALNPTGLKSAAYTAAPFDDVTVNTSGGPVPIAMPPATVTPGAPLVRVRITNASASGTNPATVTPAGSDTFLPAGSPNPTAAPGESLDCVCFVAGRWSLV